MAIFLGLAAALTYGAADFLGGLMTRRSNEVSVVLVGQTLGTGLLLAALPFFYGSGPEARWLVWGAAAGVGGGVGVLFLFRGLAIGKMSVVAPVTGVVAASAPVVYGLISGERPSALALGGVGVAFVAITLASLGTGDRDDSSDTGLKQAIVAGLCFAAFFIFLDQAGDDSGLWPLVGGRTTSLAVVGLVALFTRSARMPKGPTLVGVLASGVLDVAANLFYLLATRRGLLSIVAVLTSLYPATTAVLARVFLKERMTVQQLLGVGFAGAGVVLIALG